MFEVTFKNTLKVCAFLKLVKKNVLNRQTVMSKSTRSVLTYPTGTIQIQYLQTLRENMPVFSVKKNKTHLAVKFDFICDIKLVFQQQLEI